MAETAKAQAPIYFPPPPTVATVTDTNKTAPFKFNFKTRPGTSDSSASTFTTSSFQKPQPKPILRQPNSKVNSTKRARQYILLTQLLLSFTILILAVIFAYCAALPHSDNIDPSASTSSFATTPAEPTITTTTPSASSHRLTLRDTPLDQTIATTNNASFTTAPATAALTFYTATLPLLTIAHTAIELLTSLVRPETSQHTAFGNVLRTSANRRITTLLSFTTSTLLVLGWTVMQLLWTNCEIAPFLGPKAGNGEAVCPVQIRGHRMRGVSGLSIGKVTLGWGVVVVYVGYGVYLWLCVGVCNSKNGNGVVDRNPAGKTSSFRRRARYERGSSESDTGLGRGDDAESVVIAIDVEKGHK